MSVQSSPVLPFVSVVIPMRNEESFISRCLDSIIANDYPSERFEIIVADGMSTDSSRTMVRQYSERDHRIRLIDNPEKKRVTANNAGIRAARGDIIISMDAHVVYAADYIRQCVELLLETGAANVGGVQNAVGHNYVTKTIALATSTPFGIGDAEFRYLQKEKWVDTVYLGAWRKETLERVGLFNEDWLRNGDYELNYRIRKAGGKILLSPKIRCDYYVRGSLMKLAQQYYLYGKWRVKTIAAHPDSVRWRHVVAPCLIIWLALSPLLLLLRCDLWWLSVAIYLLYTTLTALLIALRKGFRYFPLLIPTLWTLHLSWGIGFYSGILAFGLPRVSLKTIIKDILGHREI